MISVLAGAGLETFAFLSVQGDEVYIKVRAPLDVLREQAKMVSYPMKLDMVELEKKFDKETGKPLIKHEQDRAYKPYQHIYIEYESKHEALFEDGARAPSDVADGKLGHAFGSVVRLKLTDMILVSDKTHHHFTATGINAVILLFSYTFPYKPDASKQ